MGKSTEFAYRTSDFVLFKLDVRCKLICVSVLSIIMTNAEFPHLCLITGLFLWLLYRSGMSIKTLVIELKLFVIMLIIIFLVRAFVTPGVPVPILQLINMDIPELTNIGFLSDIHVTREGVVDGITVAWRFLAIMLMGILFSCSTQASALKGAVYWFLKPVPFIPEKRIGVMVSLFVRFLPLILEKSHEVSDGQKARCAHLQKNPVKRIKNITIPLLKKVFNSADTLSIAMASRCYNEDRTEYEFSLSGYEVYFYTATAALCSFILFYRSSLFAH